MQRRDATRRSGLSVVLVIAPAIAFAEMPSGTTIKVVADAWLARKSGPGFGAAMTMVETVRLSATEESAKRFAEMQIGVLDKAGT